MGFEFAKVGVGNVGSYQISGIPFVSGGISAGPTTPVEIVFPSVTQRILVHNADGTDNLRVGFSAIGISGSNYYLVDGNAGNDISHLGEFRVRTNKIYLLGNNATVSNISISAELTGIVPNVDLAAGYSGSVGIG